MDEPLPIGIVALLALVFTDTVLGAGLRLGCGAATAEAVDDSLAAFAFSFSNKEISDNNLVGPVDKERSASLTDFSKAGGGGSFSSPPLSEVLLPPSS